MSPMKAAVKAKPQTDRGSKLDALHDKSLTLPKRPGIDDVAPSSESSPKQKRARKGSADSLKAPVVSFKEVTSPSPTLSESLTFSERLHHPVFQVAIKHTVLALFKDGARALSRGDYTNATGEREDLFLIAAQEFQRSQSGNKQGVKATAPALATLRGIAASLNPDEKAAFYLSLSDCLEREVAPQGANLYREMIRGESKDFQRRLFDHARLSLGRGSEGARGVVSELVEASLGGSPSLIPPRQALEALVESVFPVRGAATPAGARDSLYNARVKEIVVRVLARPDGAPDAIKSLCALDKQGIVQFKGEADAALSRDALRSVLSLGTPTHVANALRGMALSGNLAMMTAARDCALHADPLKVPADFTHGTLSALASTVSSKSADSSQAQEDKMRMLKSLCGAVTSVRVSHTNVVEILRAANSHNSVWGSRRLGWEIFKSEPVFARRVAHICSADIGSHGPALKKELRGLLKESLLAPGFVRQVERSISQGTLPESVGKEMIGIRKALFSPAQRFLSWARGLL